MRVVDGAVQKKKVDFFNDVDRAYLIEYLCVLMFVCIKSYAYTQIPSLL